MKKLYENIIEGIGNWLDNIQSSYGISPSTTLVLIGILLVLLILIISNSKKHKKLKKMAEQNQQAAIYLKDNMDEVLDGMDSIEDALMDFGDKLIEIEERNAKQGVRESSAQTPNIIYIDNRQGAAAEKISAEEILGNIQKVTDVPKEEAQVEEDFPVYEEEPEFSFNEEDLEVKEVEPRAIYTDRTSGVSKSGKEYTLEQLQKQIKD